MQLPEKQYAQKWPSVYYIFYLPLKIFKFLVEEKMCIFIICYLDAPWPTLGRCQEDEVGSLNPEERPAASFWFYYYILIHWGTLNRFLIYYRWISDLLLKVTKETDSSRTVMTVTIKIFVNHPRRKWSSS